MIREFLFLILFLSTANVAFAEAVKEGSKEPEKRYYRSGELMSEGTMKDGDFRSYYKSGKISLEGNFKNAKPWNGMLRSYKEDGTIEVEQNYKNGVLLDKNGKPYNGIVKITQGGSTVETPYKNGKSHGVVKIYGKNGILESETEWKDGKMDGFLKFYSNGTLMGTWEYRDGKRVKK